MKESLKKDYVNYHECPYHKVHFDYMKDNENENCLIFFDDYLLIKEKKEMKIEYHQIKKIKLGMCSRLYNPSYIDNHLKDIMLKRWKMGVLGVYGQNMIYSIDLDIYIDNNHYMFESYSLKDCKDILHHLIEKNINIEDQAHLIEILDQYQNDVELNNYLNLNYKELAKKYHFDNPRGIITNKA